MDSDNEKTWSIEDIPFASVAPELVRGDQRLFYLLASASFIEITTHLYTANQIQFFAGDEEVVGWLAREWEPDELRHGAALRRYVEQAWPEFDWQAGYRDFTVEYGRFCTLDQLEATRALQMAAMCVVETGTSTFYRMLSEAIEEPVLKRLAAAISADEVRHYKHFYRYFLRYRELERPSRTAVMRTLWHRSAEVDAIDSYQAFKSVYIARHPGTPFCKHDYQAYRESILRLGKRHYHYDMAAKMILKPLGLNPTINRAVVPALTSATRLFLLPYGH